MKRAAVLVWGGVRETLRDRLLFVILGGGILLLLIMALLIPMTLGARQQTFHDVGLAWIHFSGILMILVLGAWTLHREKDRGIWLVLLTRPIRRHEYVLSRLLSLLISLLVAVICAGLIYVLVAFGTGIEPLGNLGIGLLYIFCELSILAGLLILFSMMSGFGLSVFLSTTFFFAGHLSGDLLRLASLADSAPTLFLARVGHWLLPRLEIYRIRDDLVLGELPGILQIASALGYTLLYLAGLALLACAIFNRREIR